MSKKRLIATILLLVLMVGLNVLVFRYYKSSIDGKEIDVCISLVADKDTDIELFYLNGKSETAMGFTQEKSVAARYDKAGAEQTLTFRVPADVTYLRLDLGIEEAEIAVTKVQIQYKQQITEVPDRLLEELAGTNDVGEVEVSNSLLVSVNEGDPYLIWDVAEWNVQKIVEEQSYAVDLAVKILICLCIDVFFIIGLKQYRALITLPTELLHNRRLIWSLSKNDFKTRFAGSYLGIFWAFVQPIVTVLLYWFVFEKGLKAGGVNTRAGIEVPFVLWLIAGLVPWFFFQDALNGATNALLEYNYLVKKVVFKISILPIIKIISALFVHVFFIAFMLILYVLNGYYPHLSWIQIIYYTMGVFLLTLGISYATCAIVIFFRDLTQVIGIVLQVGTWMTPIMWNFQGIDLPPALRTVFMLNPMYYVVEGYRQALITNEWFWENAGLTIYFWIVVIACFGIGSFIFKKLRVHFADVL